MSISTKLLRNFVVLGFTVVISGCQTSQYIRTSPQTHFDYPNSNVTPLGPVKVDVPGPSAVFKSPDKPVSKEALKQLFTALKDNIHVIVLNAC